MERSDHVESTGPPPDPEPAAAVPPTAEEVFRQFGPRVYSLARRMLGSDADAEDVTQEVLLQVIRNRDKFRGESAFSTWLYRVTANAALTYRARRATREKHQAPEPLHHFLEDGNHAAPVKGWAVGPEELALSRERRELIEKAIAGLPEMYRDVFVLADVEGLPNQEIADILGMSLSAVKSRLHRARLMMRHALAPHFEEASA